MIWILAGGYAVIAGVFFLALYQDGRSFTASIILISVGWLPLALATAAISLASRIVKLRRATAYGASVGKMSQASKKPN